MLRLVMDQMTNMTDLVNKLRLQNFEAESYYNSGVLLMNLTSHSKRSETRNYFRIHCSK